MHKAVGGDMRRDPGRVLAVLASLAPDVAVLQEVDRRLGPRPAVLPRAMIEEHGLTPAPVAVPGGVSLGWHGNAVLLGPRVAARGAERLTLPGVEPRGAVLAHLHAAGRPLRVVGTHLGLTRAARRGQLAVIAARLSDGEAPALIAGDMNEWTGARGLEALSGFEVIAPGPSFPARRPLLALDRVALGPGLRLSATGVASGTLARIASDHLPVWVDLDWAGMGGAAP